MNIEIQILDWIQSIRTPAADTVMCLVIMLGNVGILRVLHCCPAV